MHETIPKSRLDELVKTLRERKFTGKWPDTMVKDELCVSAADAIEVLSAQVADLKNGWEHDTQCWREVEAHLRHQASIAEAKVEELTKEGGDAVAVKNRLQDSNSRMAEGWTKLRAQTVEECANAAETTEGPKGGFTSQLSQAIHDAAALSTRSRISTAIRALSDEVSK